MVSVKNDCLDIDSILIQELKSSILLNLKLNKDEGGQYLEPDWELIDAIEKVLEYYMNRDDFLYFKKKFDYEKMITKDKLLGFYIEYNHT